MPGTLVLFLLASFGVAALWNRFFDPVPWRLAGLFVLICAAWQAETLFTRKVDLLAAPHNVPPWQAARVAPVRANTGIVFSQLAPWTRNARNQLLSGELPLWNRSSAAGAPLLANQQTAIFHPFTLLGLPLSVGKAFTLSAALRIFVLLFFTFVFLRGFGMSADAALFGAVAYAFCTFHVVWLLFPLGLATMMLPVALAGAQRIEARAGFVLLVLGLACSVLGGHPESALWVWLTTAAFVLYQRRRVFFAASGFAIAMLLTAFFWVPTLRALETTHRFQSFGSHEVNPADHGLSYEWLLTFVAPNVLGTPQEGTYQPPSGRHPVVLDDYGEVASSYAGLITLALALTAPFAARGKALWFALGLMVFAFLTVAEVPLWRDVIRAIPLAGISLHQRLRVLWVLGVCIAAAAALAASQRSAGLQTGRSAGLRPAAACAAALFAGAYLLHRPELTPVAIVQLVIPLLTLAIFALKPTARFAAILVFVDLVVATWRYNPPAKPEEVYPVTGAIRYLQSVPKPARMAAWGWTFLPETPGWYGLEDLKATDPVQHFWYMRMLRGYLDIPPDSYDLVIGNVERPFFDYLNVRHLYVPPGDALAPKGFVERYRGPDGRVLENLEALPRAFLVRSAALEPDTGAAVYRSRDITDYREHALVDRAPAPLPPAFAGGDVRIAAYESNRTILDIDSKGPNLLVTSDVHWRGWRATWNGQPREVVTVNAAFAGVFIPAGRGRLEFRYRPEEVGWGMWAGVVGVVMFIGVLAIASSRVDRSFNSEQNSLSS
ncbi:MAG TPA: YfhO family protein [Thermoanaerobaculia bacterium]|nr:YfhO family protein [Thermoanaerobaculia bacterium]